VSDEREHYYEKVLEFDSDDPEFTRGFEAGWLWNNIEDMAKGEEWCQMVHASNTEMVMRMCVVQDVGFTAGEINDDWMHVCFTGRKPE
jgi:hypothetical protein